MIQVGQVLDKYELLERVGQGGMAVVYRGLDRDLKRVVAIKILHKHLSDYQEARDRFEREAQAVAKLRHENILEIFDYSGADMAEELGASYIVTEFIDGQTLKQLFTERPISFPEIGAMLMLQVCRALAHAHANSILHRDIKPENIMIRSDGVVKLMDFGISHMVDLERLTVTGQLLGSPAYMAPEHVEGRPIDYRTDVFAVGIVLYQLTAGKLPFEGKNPHEVLKRIADCKFVDPRQVNPRIGNRLGRIILRAMAARPDDRFPTIGQMVTALEGYLEESGLPTDKISGELGRYFSGPVAYEGALKDRLLDHLTRRGQKLFADDDQAAALDVFDRVLTIDPQNAKVLGILDSINRRQRIKKGALVAAVACGLAGGAWAIHHNNLPPEPETPPDPDRVSAYHIAHPQRQVAHEVAVVPIDAALVVVIAPPIDAGGHAVAPIIDAGSAVPDPVAIATTVFVAPATAEYSLGESGPWLPVPGDNLIKLSLASPTVLHVRSTDKCCEAEDLSIQPGENPKVVLQLLPANVRPTCSDKTVDARVDQHAIQLDHDFTIAFKKDDLDSKRTVTIEFLGGGSHVDHAPIKIEIAAGKTREVPCIVH